MKIKNHFLFIILISLFGFSSLSKADSPSGIHFLPKIMYLIDNTTINGGSTNISRLLLDGGIGYKFSQPIYIGAQYGYDNKTTTSGATTHDVYSSYGPTVGLMTDNVYFLFTYYISSQYQNQANAGNTTYTNGNGFQLDFAYLLPIGSKVSLGPSLSYRSLTYTSVQNPNGSTGSTNYNYVTLLPYIAFNFAF